MEEQRRHVRLPLRAEIAFAALPSGTAQETHTKDMCEGGLCLSLKQPLPPGAQLQVAMALPGVEEPINALAEVVWCREERVTGKTEQSKSIQAGARLTEIAPNDLHTISQVIAQSLR
jgi:hypothetical protein